MTKRDQDDHAHSREENKSRLSSSDARTAGFNSENLDDIDSAVKVAGFSEEGTTRDDPSRRSELRKDKSPQRLPLVSEKLIQERSLSIPPEIPGASAPLYLLLPRTDDADPEATSRKMAEIERLFPQRGEPIKIGAPSAQIMTLEELEDLALENNPTIAQARASITVSQGGAVQAGVYPNPTMGYESDTVGSSFTRNYQGITIQQPIKTAGKLALARGAANMDVMNSQLAYERTRLDVLHSVRTSYYDVLVSQEAMKFNEALDRLTRRVYLTIKERFKEGESSEFELPQYNSLVIQARATLVQSQNRYLMCWKQLAVATGIPDLKPATLEGRVEMPVPNLDYANILERMLAVHPDLYAARNLEQQAQIQLKLQRAIPFPDITMTGAFQNDFTVPNFNRTSYNLDVTVPLPFFDRNQGNIKSALGKLKVMSLQNSAKTLELTNQLNEAFNRFQTGRYLSESYRNQIMPNLVRAYQLVYNAHLSENTDVAFGDIIIVQQNLSNGVAAYVASLTDQWEALTDIADLMQLRDFRELWTLQSIPSLDSKDIVPSPLPQEGTQP